MTSTKSFADELATRYYSPASLLSRSRTYRRYDTRTLEQLRQWISSNFDYVTSPDFARFQQLPSIAPLWGYDEVYYRKEVTCELLRITRLAGRRLTPEEMSIYLQFASKWTVAQSYDRPAALATTLFFAYRGRWSHEFPFGCLTSKTDTRRTINPYVFPSASRPLLKGSLASASWHGVRFAAWCGLGASLYYLIAPLYRRLFRSEADKLLAIEPRLSRLAEDVQKMRERLAIER